jgi:hypothetical protein
MGKIGGAMSTKLTAYCGLVCTDWPAYIAKRTGDDALRAKTAERWSAPGFSVATEEVNCDGCTVPEGVRFKYCDACEVRQCASSRGVATCAECEDYACEKLERLIAMIGPEIRTALDTLRAGA